MHTTETITVESKKNFAYDRIADALAQAGDIDGAKALLNVVGNATAKSGIYESTVEGQTKKGDIAAAKATAENISIPFLKDHANEHIALAQAASGDLDGAKATIGAITADDVRAEAYVYLAEQQFKAGKKNESRQTMILARAAAKQVPSYLAPLALSNIASGEVKMGNLSDAMQIVNGVSDSNAKNLIIDHIAEAQVEMGNLAEAKLTAARLTETMGKIVLDGKLAGAEAKNGDKDSARNLVKEAIALMATLPIPPIRAIAAECIATAQVQTTDATAAADWARSQKDPEVRVRALIGVVDGLPDYHAPSHP
jgi:hypothetical protein